MKHFHPVFVPLTLFITLQDQDEAISDIDLCSFLSFLVFAVKIKFSESLSDGVFIDVKQTSKNEFDNRDGTGSGNDHTETPQSKNISLWSAEYG